MKIIPAVLPQRYFEIQTAVERVYGSADIMQIDIVDGYFAHNKTWPLNQKDAPRYEAIVHESEGLPHWEEIDYEFDLMVRDPLAVIDTIMPLGPSKLILHVESLDEAKTLEYFEMLPSIIKDTVSFGIALSLDTPLETLTPYLPHVTSIQCMGIANVGFQGQTFDPRVIEQIKMIRSRYPELPIVVDGGVNESTIPALLEAGATELVVGSAIFQSADPRATMEMLSSLCRSVIRSEN